MTRSPEPNNAYEDGRGPWIDYNLTSSEPTWLTPILEPDPEWDGVAGMTFTGYRLAKEASDFLLDVAREERDR